VIRIKKGIKKNIFRIGKTAFQQANFLQKILANFSQETLSRPLFLLGAIHVGSRLRNQNEKLAISRNKKKSFCYRNVNHHSKTSSGKRICQKGKV
jgi:hypothetical protein